MKFLHNIGLLSIILTLFASCSSDGERFTLLGFDKAQIVATQSEVTITNENKSSVALSLVWTENELTSNNQNIGIANTQRTDILQVDTKNTFESAKETYEKTSSKSYTGAELNALALKLGLPTGQAGTLYFRLKSSISANTATLFSNIVAIRVTPTVFEDDAKGIVYLPTKSSGFTDFGNRLYSAADDGKYEGFVYAAQWDNFRIYTTKDAATASIYGSKPNELYKLDDSDGKWDIWFDEGGYFFVEADLKALTWKKTAVTSLSIVGDFNSWNTSATPLTYDPATKKWTTTCNISTIGWGIKFLVNQDWSWVYTDKDGNGLLQRASDPNIVPASTGTYKVTVDLSNPAKLSYKLEKQ